MLQKIQKFVLWNINSAYESHTFSIVQSWHYVRDLFIIFCLTLFLLINEKTFKTYEQKKRNNRLPHVTVAYFPRGTRRYRIWSMFYLFALNWFQCHVFLLLILIHYLLLKTCILQKSRCKNKPTGLLFSWTRMRKWHRAKTIFVKKYAKIAKG